MGKIDTPPLPNKYESLWIATTPKTNFPSLKAGLEVDAAIIGGGIVGITTAILLKEAGLKVAVIEAKRVVEGATGYTTAKITSQHGLIYDYLINTFGREKAKIYADASESAINKIEAIIKKYKINCDFKRTEAYTFTENKEEVESIKKEVEAAISLGLPASFVEKIPLSLSSYGAIKFDNQAQFHPRKYLLPLVDKILGNGSFVFENTIALSFDEGEPCIVKTDQGEIRAKDIVVATHVPFFKNPGAFFSRLYQIHSYALGIYIKGEVPEGMYISTKTHTIRNQPTKKGNILILGGGDHKVGQGGDILAIYKGLADFYAKVFPVKRTEYSWSTQDPDTPDRVPFIGRVSPNSKHVFMASGFGGWGMTNGTVSAMLLSDLILGKNNPWEDFYDPSRVDLTALAPRFVTESANVVKEFVGGKLNQGQAPSCTFEGCKLIWNNAEKTWDCPCCGSRFNADGTVLYGPAVKPLENIKI